MTERTAELSPVKRALLEIRELRTRLARVESSRREPIAIVGCGCRLPGGVHDLESLWQVLRDGVDTIREIPANRWDAAASYDADPDRPGTIATRAGGFLDDIDLFDAGFFGIAPREAASMDPQQRLFLEVAWEALEHAGIAPDSLAGSSTGVFAGAANADYLRLLFGSRDRIDAYAGSGGSLSVIPGRLSYLLGLAGPSLTVDTACSSSLVALHLAVQSLRAGECDLAIAGGVNLILSPEAHVTFTKARMLAPDGRSKAFSAEADGYGRGEGCGVLVLRRLGDARAKGDRVLAVVRGTAVNQDGRSGGLTAPNGPAQSAVIRAALTAADLQPADVDYVEAHGTGTPLGDPIELQALAAALGAGRTNPLAVGSCKTNFGHLEAAAGVAGVLKVVAAMHHREVPPHLHLTRPNPHVDWASLPVRIPTTLEGWPGDRVPARAGVSSFGFSGTNAHVILEAAPGMPPLVAVSRSRYVLALSAPTDGGLRELARRYREHLAAAQPSLAPLCATANSGRAKLARRLAVTGADVAEIEQGLVAFLDGRAAAHVAVASHERVGPPVVAFLFTGQGAQYPGMGRELYDSVPVFREAIDRCASSLDSTLERPLAAVIRGDVSDADLQQTSLAQPALFALEYALAQVWRHWGIEPAVVLGHSLGEIAAAVVAGALTLDDGLALVAARGRILQQAPDGGMLAVSAPEPTVRALLSASGIELDIAARNAADLVVLSGPHRLVGAARDAFAARGIEAKELRVSHAFHSRLIDPVLDELERAVAGLATAPPSVPLVSNLSGAVLDPSTRLDGRYWRTHARQPVEFEASVRSVLALGATHLLEIGPAPVLLGMAARSVAEPPIAALASLRRNEDGWAVMLESVARLFADGADLDWERFEGDRPRQVVTLPPSAFQRRRHWIEPSTTAPSASPEDRWNAVTSALARESLRGPIGVDLAGVANKWALLEQLTNAHAVTTFLDAGIFADAGDRATVAGVAERLGARPTYRHLLGRWLDRLAATSALARDGEAFVAECPLARPDMASLWNEVEHRLADDRPLVEYVRHCGRLLHAVIAGRENALETLFPSGRFDLAEGLYERSGALRYGNELAAAAAASFASATAGRALRVLELGAGTGSSTASLLPALSASCAEYWFTDLTPAFFDRGRQRFGAHACLRFAELDLERDPVAQGFPAGGFDLVFAGNTVHAARDVRRALRHLRALVASGGVALLLETTEHHAWLDMTIGLFDGWQHFEDDLRRQHPLLSPSGWVDALRASDFADVAAYPGAGTIADAIGIHVVAARVAGGAMSTSEDAVVHAARAASDAALPEPAWRADLHAALPSERRAIVEEIVRAHVVGVLRLAPEEAPGPLDRLVDRGFDSLMAVQFRTRLGQALSLDFALPATLLYDHPSIDALTGFVLDLLSPPEPSDRAHGDMPGWRGGAVDAAAVAAMSDEEIERVLIERLGTGTSSETRR